MMRTHQAAGVCADLFEAGRVIDLNGCRASVQKPEKLAFFVSKSAFLEIRDNNSTKIEIYSCQMSLVREACRTYHNDKVK